MDKDFDLRDFDGRVRLFPLKGVVLFPHAVLPLHIFEPRYRQMTRDALASDKFVTIVQTRSHPSSEPSTEPEIEPVACLGRILNHEPLPDGRFNFLLLGRKRVRIIREIEASTLYRQAQVEILDDIEMESVDHTLRRGLIDIYRDVAQRADGLDPDLDQVLKSEPPLGVLTDLLAQALGLPPSVKQALLADCHVDRRAGGLMQILRQVSGHLDRADHARPYPPPPFSAN